ncbi:MAG: twin-arginine translocase subunit TatC [Candidatus Nanohalobium sp.]
MQSLEDHVVELRNRLKVVSVFLLASTGFVFYYSADILNWVQADLGFDLNALSAYEVFYTEIMIALLGGFLISLPVVLFQLLKFMRPGLKDHEYRVMRNYLPFSVVLFAIGAVFAYEFVVKASLNFFQGTARAAEVEALWSLQNTVSFALRLSAFTGIVFQLPIVSVILGRAGVMDVGMMKEYRAHFIIAVLVLSAFVTPPDVISQALVTLPVIGLYQISIFLVGKVQQEDKEGEAEEEGEDDEGT